MLEIPKKLLEILNEIFMINFYKVNENGCMRLRRSLQKVSNEVCNKFLTGLKEVPKRFERSS